MNNSNVSQINNISKGGLWTGRMLNILCLLFLTFDAVMKIIKEKHSIEGSVKLGWPENLIQPLGIVLLVCTIILAIPRTAILGAVLVTAYLGGAVSSMVRIGEPFFFPIIFGILIWAGLYLRDAKVRSFIPLRR